MKPSIRYALPSDAEIIAEYNIAMAMETEQLVLEPDRVLSGVRTALENPDHGFYLLAEVDGEVLGQMMVTYEWSDWRNGVFWWIQSVYVHPSHRQEGIFSMLFRHVEQEAKGDATVCGLRLYVEKNNHRAQNTYEHLGMMRTHYEVFETDFVLKK